MTFKKTALLSATAILLGAAAFAGPIADRVVEQLRAQGYVDIEVYEGADRIKVEAKKQGREREVLIDATTGAVLSDETEAYGGKVRERLELHSGTELDDDEDMEDDSDDYGRAGKGHDDDDDDHGRSGKDSDDDDDKGQGSGKDDEDDS